MHTQKLILALTVSLLQDLFKCSLLYKPHCIINGRHGKSKINFEIFLKAFKMIPHPWPVANCLVGSQHRLCKRYIQPPWLALSILGQSVKVTILFYLTIPIFCIDDVQKETRKGVKRDDIQPGGEVVEFLPIRRD